MKSNAHICAAAMIFAVSAPASATYVTKLNQVNAAGKLDDPTGQTYMTLSNGAAGVTSCIDNIGK